MKITLPGNLFSIFHKSAVNACRIRILFTFVICISLSNELKAQLVSSYYTFYQYNEDYSPGISTTSVTPASVFATGWDDNTTTYPIPFNFTYNGTLYTTAGTIGVDTDGWLAFSTGAITMTGTTAGGSWVSFSDHTGVYLYGTANNNGFTGFNCDLDDQSFTLINATGTNGSNLLTSVSSFTDIRIGTRLSGTGITNGTVVTAFTATSITMSAPATASGTISITPWSSIYGFIRGVAPYRQFVVQWTQVKRFGGTGTDIINFQLVINEGGGLPLAQTIQTVYGSCTATSTTDLNVQVGLRGATAADFNARKSAADWSATTAATVNTDNVKFNNTINPPNTLVFNWSPQCISGPSVAGPISGTNPVCPNTIVVYSLAGVPNANYYTWTYTGTGATFSATTTLPSVPVTFNALPTGGTLTVTPQNLCGTGTAASIVISVGAGPSATISYPAASYCISYIGTIPVTQTGTSGGTYSASPAGLTINAAGAITPSSSLAGTYIVTYTFTNGTCSGTATANITFIANPVVNVSATPSTVCIGGNSQLLANVTGIGNYTVSSIAYSSLAPTGTPVVLWSTTYTDDAISAAIPLPFAFNYYSNAITQFFVSSNGHIQLQNAAGSALTEQTLPDVATPNNVIALAWDDLVIDNSTNPGTYVRYFTNGTAPNRVLVVEYFNLSFLLGTSQNVSGQIRLYESDNHIEVAVGNVDDNGSLRTKTLGIENSIGTIGIAPAGRNNVIWNVTNEAWAFYPPSGLFTYLWSPATFLSSTVINNPFATAVAGTTNYSVTVTNTVSGCISTTPLTVTIAAPLNGTYTVGIAGNFPTLTAAVNAYNNLCISGPVIFSLIDNTYPGEIFPIIINSNTYANATNTLSIKPAVGLSPVITGNNSIGILKLNGADYITIDGSNTVSGTTRNLSIINTSTNSTTSTIVWLASVNASNGATNNTVKNCTLTGNAPTTTFTSLISSGSVVGGIAEAANNNNTYQNNLLSKCQTAIAIVGPTGNETGNIISGNTIGSVTAGNKLGWSGIEIYQQASCQITNNTIFGITTATSTTVSGISVYGTASGISINGNKVSDIKNTSTGGWGSNGIYLGSSSTAANVNVFNNVVFDIASYGYTGGRDENDNGYGIIVDGGGGYNIYYNTVHLNTAQSVSGYPACMNVTSFVTTAASIHLENNIFSNVQSNTGQRYAIQSEAASTVFNSINYNDYYSAAANLGYIGATNRAVLANIQAGFGQNLNAISYLPVYTSATDYHINVSNAANITNLENRGNPVTGYTDDFDVQTRNGLTPDLGADEWVEPNYGSWVGKISTDWTVPANWEANYVPDLTTDVFITGGYTFMPAIITTQAIRNLSLSAPGTPPLLTLNTATLEVYGTITRTGGTINGSNGTLEMKGSAAQTIPAGLFQTNNLKNLIISNTEAVNGVTLGGTLDIYRSLTFGTGGRRLATGSFLTFKSTAMETAWLGQMLGTNIIVGEVTIERYIPLHSKAWQFLSTPITATSTQTLKQAWQEGAATANGNPVPGFGTMLTSNKAGAASQPTPGFDAYTAAGPSIKTYKTGGGYNGINRTDTAISNLKGYMVFIRGDRSVITTGAAPTATVMRTKGNLHTPAVPPVTINITAPGFESVGNPYASAINYRLLIPTGGVQTDFFYLWDPKLTTIGANSAWGLGGFQTFSWNNGTGVFDVTPGGGSYSGSNRLIESGQAFFVHASLAAGTLPFTENCKVSGSNDVNRVPFDNGSQLRTNLNVIRRFDRILLDGNLIQYHRSFSNSVDSKDGIKIDNMGENLGLSRDGKELSVERRSSIVKRDTVFYHLGQMRIQLYELEFIPVRLQEPGLIAWLEDNYLHSVTQVSLSDTARLQFTVDNNHASALPDRFRLVFLQKKQHERSAPQKDITTTGMIYPGEATGKFSPSSETAAISVFPNPVVSKTMQLKFFNQPAGIYAIRLINKMGQQVYNTSVELGQNDLFINIPLSGIASGTYLLRISSNGMNKKTLQVIVL